MDIKVKLENRANEHDLWKGAEAAQLLTHIFDSSPRGVPVWSRKPGPQLLCHHVPGLPLRAWSIRFTQPKRLKFLLMKGKDIEPGGPESLPRLDSRPLKL